MLKNKLFDNEYNSDSDNDLKTDNNYASSYNTWRQKEELNKLKTKYGEDITLNEGESGSSSSSDDDEGEYDAAIEKDFFTTLACLKNKDPRIYDTNVNFFEAAETSASYPKGKKKNKSQPMFIKDYERKILLENEGHVSESDEEIERPKSPTYIEEQQNLKENLKNVLEDVEDDGEEWGGMFKAREKTTEEATKEEQEYKSWLAGRQEQIKDQAIKTTLEPLKNYWSNPNLDDEEKFLRDYILNKKFMDTEDADYIPTYEEMVHDSDEGLSEDEKVLDTQEEFEHKYNFRFEEPDQEFIKRFPRTMENSLRKSDDRRKLKRVEVKERKKQEKQKKMEEIKQLKTLKRKEIEEKIQKLREITGNTEIAFEVGDIDDDFDPEEHDRRMQNLFNNEFYQGPEEEQKPEFPDLDEELELENWDRWHGTKGNEKVSAVENEVTEQGYLHCEDDNFNMDCDYDPANVQKELIENSRSKKRRKRKSKFAKVVSQEKPVFDPNDKTFEEYVDEYYKLDCEDIIGDIPCRFKYRKVVPNSFGLTIEEILAAKDRELNRWCSIKKAVQYRPDHVENYDVIAYQQKSKNENLKRKILPSLFEEQEKLATATATANSLQSKNKKVKNKTTNNLGEGSSTSLEIQNEDSEQKFAEAVQKNNKKVKNTTGERSISDEIKMINIKQLNAKDSTAMSAGDDDSVEGKISKKDRKRKHTEIQESSTKQNEIAPKKDKRKKSNANRNKKHNEIKDNIGLSDARLSAYGFNPKKFKNKLKYGNN